MTGEQKPVPTRKQALQKWLPPLTELWIFGVVAMFFVVRILGSSTVQNLLRKAGQ